MKKKMTSWRVQFQYFLLLKQGTSSHFWITKFVVENSLNSWKILIFPKETLFSAELEKYTAGKIYINEVVFYNFIWQLSTSSYFGRSLCLFSLNNSQNICNFQSCIENICIQFSYTYILIRPDAGKHQFWVHNEMLNKAKCQSKREMKNESGKTQKYGKFDIFTRVLFFFLFRKDKQLQQGNVMWQIK